MVQNLQIAKQVGTCSKHILTVSSNPFLTSLLLLQFFRPARATSIFVAFDNVY